MLSRPSPTIPSFSVLLGRYARIWTVASVPGPSTAIVPRHYLLGASKGHADNLGFVSALEMFRSVVIRHPMLPCRCNPVAVARRLLIRASLMVVYVLTGIGFGCSSGAGGGEVKAPTPQHREERVDLVVVTAHESLTAFELLERGRRALESGAMVRAARDLDLVVEQDPKGPWVEEALYLGAKAYEGNLDYLGAASRFRRVAVSFANGELARDAMLRAVRLFVYLEEWQQAGELSHAFVARYPRRSPREEIVVQSALALRELAEAGSSPEGRARALSPLTHARSVIEKYQLDSAGTIPRDLAQVYYAKGELLRLEGESVGFVPLPDDFADQFERRAQLLLDAQSAYSDVMRAHDAHWTAMAGYRVGELYKRLHEDVMRAPRPPALDTERRRLIFEAALRLRYSILLQKGLNLMEHTLALAERTGQNSEWVRRARLARDELQLAFAAEQAAVDACPYSREDMQRVLREVAERNAR